MSPAPTPSVSGELKQVLRRLKLGKTLDTLPERLALARQQKLSHAAFLELVLADEVDRRDRTGAARRARAAGLDPTMTLQAWDDHDAISYDHDILAELVTLRFVEDRQAAFILGPVGVGKTHLAHALGHIACRRRIRVHAERADRLFNGSRPHGWTTATNTSCAGSSAPTCCSSTTSPCTASTRSPPATSTRSPSNGT